MVEARPAGPETSEARDSEAAGLRARLRAEVGRICPRWLADRQEDLVHTGLLRLLEMRERREGTGPVATSYLRKVAYSVLVDEIRRLRRRPEVPLEEVSGGEPEPPGSVATPERKAAQLEMGAAIAACLSELKPERRQTLVLYLEGYSVPEAARLLDWSLKKTENLVYRGLSDLRKCLRSKGMEP